MLSSEVILLLIEVIKKYKCMQLHEIEPQGMQGEKISLTHTLSYTTTS